MSKEISVQTLNLLELPNEILLKIFSFIPKVHDHILLSTTCNRFYDLSCQTRSCALKIELVCDKDFFGAPLICYDHVVDNIISSKRKISSLSLNFNRARSNLRPCSPPSGEFLQTLEKIVRVHGKNIKEFYFSELFLSSELIFMLNLTPNMKKMKLSMAQCQNLIVPEDFQLKLPKLREVIIEDCGADAHGFLNHLTADVLVTVKFYTKNNPVDLKFLDNQRKVKDLTAGDYVNIDISHMKLEKLDICFEQSIDLRGQDEMKKLTLRTPITDEDLKIFSRELKSLEVIDIGYQVDDYSPLQNLRNLKKVIVKTSSRNLFETAKSSTVTEMQLRIYRDEAVDEAGIIQLSRNCPNLTHLTIKAPVTFHVKLNMILQQLPRLEKLECLIDMEGYEYVDGAGHENLKHLGFGNTLVNSEMIKLIKGCKKLESLRVHFVTKTDFLNELLPSLPNMKIFCCMSVLQNFSEDFNVFGRNLLYFHISSNILRERSIKRLQNCVPVFRSDENGLVLARDDSIKCNCNDPNLFFSCWSWGSED